MYEGRIWVTGKVQGVFFRKQAKIHALQCNLCGFAKNLPDNSVHILVQGSKENIEKFLVLLQKEPGKAVISKVSLDIQKISHVTHSGFAIL